MSFPEYERDISRSLVDFIRAGIPTDSTIDCDLVEWWNNFDPRSRKEILLALEYDRHFQHGTSGHLAYMVIARLAKVLEVYRQKALER